jgi:hypothetical protein
LNKITTDNIVGVFLGTALLVSIFYGSNELSTSIASGLIGYMGRTLTEGREGVK